ncbi:MAG TPA: hypothetical protein VEL51_21670 [Vicinamibacterales bacterium]|nr:hypothetical protein [Vicinamibacterales bacterium]
MKGGIDAEIERLYQGPLEDFTAARNALAKTAGKRAAEVRALAKPPAAAWATNQVYWRRRDVYDALIDAAQEVRKAHAAVLAGRGGDVRAAGKEHDARVNAALDAALEILLESGHPPTDATRQAILTTLRALPAAEPAGLLTRTLQPGGFEALAGLSIRGAKAPAIVKRAPKAEPAEKGDNAPKTNARDAKALARARDEVAAATRVLKEAEHAAQRQEFESARAARDAEKATKAVETAREAVEEAQSELAKAESAQAAAVKKKEAAERRAQEAETAADGARTRLEEARAALEGL